MTNEEAIEIIKREFAMDEDVEALYPEVVKAREMAIEALKAQPCEDVECNKCANQHSDKCKNCMCFEYNGRRVTKPTNFEKAETQPCDAVSREAVDTLIDELARAISDERCYISRGRDTSTIMQDILDLPSVQPERAKGERVKLKVGYGCPFCSLATNQRGIELYRFCPNCGADMRGEQE